MVKSVTEVSPPGTDAAGSEKAAGATVVSAKNTAAGSYRPNPIEHQPRTSAPASGAASDAVPSTVPMTTGRSETDTPVVWPPFTTGTVAEPKAKSRVSW